MVCWGHVRTDVTTWRTADSVVVVIAHVQKTTLPATEAVSFCLAKSRMIKRSKKNCRFYRVMKIKSMNKVLKTSQSLLCHFWEFLEYTFYISFYRLLGLYHASFKWKNQLNTDLKRDRVSFIDFPKFSTHTSTYCCLILVQCRTD